MNAETIITIIGAVAAGTGTLITAALIPLIKELKKPREHDENLAKRIKLLEESSLAGNKYRLNQIMTKIEVALKRGGSPSISDVLVMEDSWKIYSGQGGNGEMKKRYENIKSELIKSV